MESENEKPSDVDMVLHVVDEAQKEKMFINMKGVEQIALEVMTYIVRNIENFNFGEVALNYVRLSSEYHPERYDSRAADWLFVLNTLNFSTWVPNNAQEWKVNGLTGYMAVAAAIKRAIDDGKPIWDPKFYTKLTVDEMKFIFRGDDNNDMPGTHEKLKILHAVGNTLLDCYKGTFAECIKSCNRDALMLMITIHNNFGVYRDVVYYDEESVSLYTKAWTLVADIRAFYSTEHELGIELTMRKCSTMFVDYRIPQVLNHFNALVFKKNLLKEENEILKHGSKEELEIRCCSCMIIKYVQQLLMERCEKYVKRYLPETLLPKFDYMCLIDNFLWDYRQMYDEQLKKSVLYKTYTLQY
ncbi:PREDICTED: UPF0553 protein C9orf64 homolog isoform X1 [Wasmannia auropunctata]|uniref:UPF0553 protein C9orf64 homolog isoform X1 n=1 Tax=Wasmannia auropunctata TaxID=64793 RepID=UPI0005F0C537|nr:PREDICTED: UPF0553 protein C9orf64 homolog isoform X1 [Wasmannia auropunctata]